MLFRNDIQGLRALAFLIVFIFHLNSSWLPGGFIGVDMFFVISGYLITSIMMSQKQKGNFSFITFYEKRIKRILPAQYFMLFAISIVGYFVYLYSDILTLRASLAKAFLFISNNHFATGDSYFGSKLAENPLLHTWSLSIEMQFYLILPLILILVNNKFILSLITFLLVAITIYVTYNLLTIGVNSQTYFSLLARMPEFFIGTLLSLIFSKRSLSENTSLLISLVGLTLIVLSLIFITEHTPFPGMIALIPCLGTGLLLISGTNLVSRFFSSRPLVYIGELSYSLYLWHWPIIALIRYKNGWASPTPFNITETLIIIISTILLSLLSYYLVENKFRHFSNKQFIMWFAPISLLFATFIMLTPKLKEEQKIPLTYAKSEFGQKSHNTGHTEILGDSTSLEKKIFLFGDSHSLVLKHFLDKIGWDQHFGIKTLTTSGYPALKNIALSEISPNLRPLYFKMQKSLNSTYENIDSADIIILSGIDFSRIPSMEKAIENIAQRLRPEQRLILIKTYPVLDRDPIRVNNGFVRNSDVKFNILDRKANYSFLDRVAKNFKNVHVFDLSKSTIFKNAPYAKDTVMYYDDNHLNIYGTSLLYDDLGGKFTDLIKSIW